MMDKELNLTYLIEDLDREFTHLLDLKDCQLIFDEDEEDMIPLFFEDKDVEIKKVQLLPIKSWVAAVDSTCIKLATTNKGNIFALRATIVFSHNKNKKFFRIGPYLLHIKAKEEFFSSERNLLTQILRLRIERKLQKFLAENLEKSVIIIDGSLKYSIFEPKPYNLKEIFKEAKGKGNLIVGISKKSNLLHLQRLISYLHKCEESPSLIVFPKREELSLGQITLTKFTKFGVPLRVDYQDALDLSLSILLNNEDFYLGYPESLNLAHRLSIFTSLELLTLKCYVIKKGAIEVPSYNLRRLVLK